MIAFRILLVGMFLGLAAYTAVTITHHGWNLLPVFFGDMLAMGWPGQFNADFLGFLILSALWTAWRRDFTLPGLLLAPLAFSGGILFLSAYLMVLSFATRGDMAALMLGPARAARLRLSSRA